jgi:repressor LexA
LNTFDTIDFLLKKNHKRQIDLTNYLGVPKAIYTGWKSGRTRSYTKYLPQIADFFGVSVDYLLGKTDIPIALEDIDIDKGKLPVFEPIPFLNDGAMILGSPKVYAVPVYNSIEAGFAHDLNENIIDFRFVTLSSADDMLKNVFVTVNDASMSPRIENGDLVQVYKTDSVDSGDLAVVSIDDKDISVRKVIYGHGWVELQAFNPQYTLARFEKDNIDRVRILGRIEEIISRNNIK